MHAAVGKGDGGRAVPGLHQRRVVFVERPLLRLHVWIRRPRLRESAWPWHAAANGRTCTSSSSALSRRRGIAAARLDDGKKLLDIVAEQRRSSTDWRACIQLTLPRTVLISPLCATIAVGMRQRPGGKRIGGKALVHQAQRAHHVRIASVPYKTRRSAERAAVLYRRWCATKARGYRKSSCPECRTRRFPLRRACGRRRACAPIRPASCRVGAPTKICWIYGCEARATRPMALPSMGVSRQPSTVRPSSRDDALEDAFALQACVLLHRQEDHAHAIFARRRQA